MPTKKQAGRRIRKVISKIGGLSKERYTRTEEGEVDGKDQQHKIIEGAGRKM